MSAFRDIDHLLDKNRKNNPWRGVLFALGVVLFLVGMAYLRSQMGTS